MTQERKQRAELIKKFSGFFVDLDQSRILNKVDLLMSGAGLPPASYSPTPELASQVLVEKGAYMAQEYPLKDLARKINPDLQEAAPRKPARVVIQRQRMENRLRQKQQYKLPIWSSEPMFL